MLYALYGVVLFSTAISALLIFITVKFFKKRRDFRERGIRAQATVTESKSRFARRGGTVYHYTLEYMIEGKLQNAKYTSRTRREVGEMAEISYLPENLQRVMLAEDFANTLANKIVGVIFVVACALSLASIPFSVQQILSAKKEAFFKLCGSGTPAQVEEAIKGGADVNAIYKTKSPETIWTPLMEAARANDNPEVLSVLIQAGADIGVKNNEGLTPLMYAAANNSAEVLNVLIQAGADVNARANGGWTPLMFAANDNGNIEILNVLIQAGADADAKNGDGWTPLMLTAINNENPEIFKALVEAGADVNVKNNEGLTPLMVAAANNSAEVLNVLIQAGADVNARDNGGWTPLMVAANDNGNIEILNVLIQAGADVDAKNDDGDSSLKISIVLGRAEIVSLLLASGATVSEEDLEAAQHNEQLKDTAVIKELKKNLKK